MLHNDVIRMPSVSYPEKGYFPDSISALIDEERKRYYQAEGAHYENLQFLTFVWKFPLSLSRKVKLLFVENLTENARETSLDHLLIQFKETLDRVINVLDLALFLKPLNSEDLLTFLNTCISGELVPVAVPPKGAFIDVVLGRKPLIGGYVPRIGDKHIYALSLVGFLEPYTLPGLLEAMDTYPLVYRWSNRFIPLGTETAQRELKRYQRNWHNKVKGFWGTVKQSLFGHAAEKINRDALNMEEEAIDAVTRNQAQSTRFGYLTCTLILMHENEQVLQQATKDLEKYVQQKGFAIAKETVNALEAWRGSIPGHGHCNITRLFVTAENFAHIAPFHTIWTGAQFSAKSSLLPPNSPPVFYAATTGKTPFRFQLDVGDVGHMLIVGPTGSGKSTWLDYLMAQFLRYQAAKIFLFDKDYSHLALTKALQGNHVDIGKAEVLSFCPLYDLSTPTQKMRAIGFIETLVECQHLPLTPESRTAIASAIESLSQESQQGNRSLTTFQAEVQDKAVRAALNYYTVDKGTFKLLDATTDSLADINGHFHTFEMNWLLTQKPEIYVPVLMHIFNHIESYLEKAQGKTPTLIPIEEAWVFLEHPLMQRKMKDWLKTLRKFNARLVLPTQSLADLLDPQTKSLTSLTATLVESCPTKLFLPNMQRDKATVELYERMGLSERQIEIISTSTPKRHYYVMTPEGNRLIELGFTKPSVALSFLGLSKAKTAHLLTLMAEEPHTWMSTWLLQQGLPEWAAYTQENQEKGLIK